MADSRTEQIIQAIVATLEAGGGPSGLTVNRSRRQAVNKTDLPMISVYPVNERSTLARPEDRRCGVTQRVLAVRIRCRVEGTDEVLDPLRQWAVARMSADLSLGGLTINLTEDEADWDAADASDGDFSVCDMLFSVRYSTARADLTKAA